MVRIVLFSNFVSISFSVLDSVCEKSSEGKKENIASEEKFLMNPRINNGLEPSGTSENM